MHIIRFSKQCSTFMDPKTSTEDTEKICSLNFQPISLLLLSNYLLQRLWSIFTASVCDQSWKVPTLRVTQGNFYHTFCDPRFPMFLWLHKGSCIQSILVLQHMAQDTWASHQLDQLETSKNWTAAAQSYPWLHLPFVSTSYNKGLKHPN